MLILDAACCFCTASFCRFSSAEAAAVSQAALLQESPAAQDTTRPLGSSASERLSRSVVKYEPHQHPNHSQARTIPVNRQWTTRQPQIRLRPQRRISSRAKRQASSRRCPHRQRRWRPFPRAWFRKPLLRARLLRYPRQAPRLHSHPLRVSRVCGAKRNALLRHRRLGRVRCVFGCSELLPMEG